ncbi:MAG: hypothetical protein ABIZ91_16500 [Gemmatimonadaceae bacterium]
MFNLTRNITARVALKALLVAFVSHTAACSNETSSPGAIRLKYGAARPLGDGRG